jgi:predicted transglutaminase-like cysteine proteinase
MMRRPHGSKPHVHRELTIFRYKFRDNEKIMDLKSRFEKFARVLLLSSAPVFAQAAQEAQAFDVRPLTDKSLKEFNVRGNPNYLQFGKNTSMLIGHADFCERLPIECGAVFKDSNMVVLNDDKFKMMQRINTEINQKIKPVTDKEKYGVDEKWTYPVNMEGDCEDYVLLKRLMLNKKIGIPFNAMSIVSVFDKKGESHAVLAVRTNRGDLIFDNLNNKILQPFETGYTFRKATSFVDFVQWQEVEIIKPKTTKNDPLGVLIEKSTQPSIPLPPRRPRGL